MSSPMRSRKVFPLALAALALVAAAVACNQTAPPQAGGVSGTYDLARVGHYVFVTSADRSELRVLDARPDGGPNDGPPHDWVRAPNPLEALQIPVVERPVGLARDLAYSAVAVDELTPAGGEITGPYVYAFASARPEISVVGADPSQMKELKRISTEGPVTAATAIGPSAAGGNSLLLYATLGGGEGRLYSVSLAPPDQIAAQTPAPQLLDSFPGQTIVSLQALPVHQEVAVATRSSSPLDGGTFAVPVGGGGARRELRFGAPIRLLATHPGTRDAKIAPETNLFGLVDEESCGGSGADRCSRILAVDVASGQPALDFTGTPALPILFTRGLPQSMTFTANAIVRTLTGGNTDAGLLDVPVMGLATNTDGRIYFFEAAGRPAYGTEPEGTLPEPQWTLRHVNQEPLPGVGTNFFYVSSADGGVAVPFPQQPSTDQDAGIPDAGANAPYYGLVQSSVTPGLGSAVAEPLAVTFEGAIPGLTALPTSDADGQSFPLPAGAPSARAAPGDRVAIALADGAACGEVGLGSVSASALTTADPIPPGCAGRASFTVRAADPLPYVVTGLLSGYMGRAGDGTKPAPDQPVAPATFTFQGTPYYRPDPRIRDPLASPLALSFQMGLRPPGIQRDDRFTFQVSAGFEPLTFGLSTDFSGWPGYHLPYGVVHLPAAPRVYASFPSVGRTGLLGSGAVIELNPTLMVPNQPNVQITNSYR